MAARAAILIVACVAWCGVGAGADPPAVRVYLPRTALAEADSLQLGGVAVVRSRDEKLAKRASAVAMGRAPWPKEKIVITRRTILSRLASVGILSDQVELTGAEEVAVGRAEKVIRVADILRAAGAFLEARRPGPTGEARDRAAGDLDASCGWRLSGRPTELVLPATGDIELQAGLAKGAPPGYVKVQVAAVGGGETLAVRNVMYKLIYPMRRAVTTKEILPGQVITKKNAKVETVMAERRPASDWTAPYGKIATRHIPAETVIRPGLVRDAKPALLVRRNQTVLMRVQGFGFVVTAIGQALQDGHCGQYIRVRNVDTRRIVTAKVTFDGTVEPLMRSPQAPLASSGS